MVELCSSCCLAKLNIVGQLAIDFVLFVLVVSIPVLVGCFIAVVCYFVAYLPIVCVSERASVACIICVPQNLDFVLLLFVPFVSSLIFSI